MIAYQTLNISAIKSFYINENPSEIAQYIIPQDPRISEMAIVEAIFSCVVFVETYPAEEAPATATKGVRKTWYEGYSTVSEFYVPDYSAFPSENTDYRRTLYWHPAVTTDEFGHAKVQFYNNSSCKNFTIGAETITPQGMIGVFQEK